MRLLSHPSWLSAMNCFTLDALLSLLAPVIALWTNPLPVEISYWLITPAESPRAKCHLGRNVTVPLIKKCKPCKERNSIRQWADYKRCTACIGVRLIFLLWARRNSVWMYPRAITHPDRNPLRIQIPEIISPSCFLLSVFYTRASLYNGKFSAYLFTFFVYVLKVIWVLLLVQNRVQ